MNYIQDLREFAHANDNAAILHCLILTAHDQTQSLFVHSLLPVLFLQQLHVVQPAARE